MFQLKTRNILLANANVSVKNSIIFGPINSRRFGMSLGIDLSPSHKQCNFDCLYCELAPMLTTNKQTQVIEVNTIIDELKKHLSDKIDVITLTANGEPTLYPHLNELIEEIDKIKNNTQTLILTNSATLTDEKVFNATMKLDQVKLSLDAVSEDIFKKIDRPHESINIQDITDKVIEFSEQYSGKLFIEILFVHGINDTLDEVKKLNEVLLKLNVKRVDLGTIDRPPAYPVVGLSYKELHSLALEFDNTLPIHIASRVHAEPNNASYSELEIINTLDKRPLTMDDIDLLFDEETIIRLNSLINDEKIIKKIVGNLEFLLPKENAKRKLKK